MDRLTYRGENGKGYVKNQGYYNHVYLWLERIAERLSSYEDTGLTPEEVAALAQAKKEGWLVELPCKVGDTVYLISAMYRGKKQIGNEVISALVDHITIGELGVPVIDCCTDDNTWYTVLLPDDYYLTREAAEAALKEGEDD